jgi:hypothetical protein
MYNRLVMLSFKVVYATASSVHVTDSGYFYMTRGVNNVKVSSEKVLPNLNIQYYKFPMDSRKSSYIRQYKLNTYSTLRYIIHTRHIQVFRIQSEW